LHLHPVWRLAPGSDGIASSCSSWRAGALSRWPLWGRARSFSTPLAA